MRFVDIVASPLFKNFDYETQQKILYKLEELKQHRTYHQGVQEPDLTKMSLLDLLYHPGNKRLTKEKQKMLSKRKHVVV